MAPAKLTCKLFVINTPDAALLAQHQVRSASHHTLVLAFRFSATTRLALAFAPLQAC